MDAHIETAVAAASRGNPSLRRVLEDLYRRLDKAEARPQAGKREVSDAEVRAAILSLGPEGFTQSGVPSVAAIEAVIGTNTSAEVRDRVWAAIEAERGDSG